MNLMIIFDILTNTIIEINIIMEVTCRFDENKYVLKIYNDCYGGGTPVLNNEAKAFFNSMCGSSSERLLLTLEKYGCDAVSESKFGKKFTRFGLCLCPKECSEFFNTDEYDGLETPYINNNEYLKFLIKEHFVSNQSLNSDEYELLLKKSINVKLELIEIDK
jgi:hypothetical protein